MNCIITAYKVKLIHFSVLRGKYPWIGGASAIQHWPSLHVEFFCPFSLLAWTSQLCSKIDWFHGFQLPFEMLPSVQSSSCLMIQDLNILPPSTSARKHAMHTHAQCSTWHTHTHTTHCTYTHNARKHSVRAHTSGNSDWKTQHWNRHFGPESMGAIDSH